jgi:L-ascorbate metabolism protein UlaG (beta-lactamase superfamily)
MDLAFETIGNATVICYDQQPILATDPWILGNAYFGSWTLTHEIPQEQMAAVKQCKYIWISHGHPDHLSLESLVQLKDKTILVPDHVGGRIATDLKYLGYKVVILEDRVWTCLSERIHVLSIADYNQDGLLLIDIGGILLVNLNDGGARGWESFLKQTLESYSETFLLKLFTFGDADMINFVDEDGRRIEPTAADRRPIGQSIHWYAERLGVRNVIPFSSLHKYQRSDSVWANRYITGLNDYPIGFSSTRCTLLPAFISYDCKKNDFKEIRPQETPDITVDPRACGDDWDEPLDSSDVKTVTAYFQSITHLEGVLDFINFRVGRKDNIIKFGRKRWKSQSQRGVRFEAPRQSLLQAIEYECFDDLLIGNFMRTCLMGKWPNSGLYPDFSPYVAKYADNGRAKTDKQLKEYFDEYRKRAPLVHYLHHRLSCWVSDQARGRLNRGSILFNAAKTIGRMVGREA